MGRTTRNTRIACLAGAVAALSGCNGEAPRGQDRDGANLRSVKHAAASKRFSDIEWDTDEPEARGPACFAPAVEDWRSVVWCTL